MSRDSSPTDLKLAWLTEGIDHLLRTMQAANSGQDVESAYDNCLWRITTSRSAALEYVVERIWAPPYSDLPTPLAVTLCRIYALLPSGSPEIQQQAQQFVRLHCTPGEEEGACEAFRIK
jgi:hypothetical protein